MGGFTAKANLHINPGYVDGAAHDYETKCNQPVLALVGDVQAAVDGAEPVQPEPNTILATLRALAQAASLQASLRRRSAVARKAARRSI